MTEGEIPTQLVDTDIVYCDPDDVFTHIRNKQYADLPADPSAINTGGGLTKQAVDDLIYKASEWADTYTRQAWRTRKVVDVEKKVRLSHKQKRPRHRRRRLRGQSRQENFGVDPRGFVNLPHNNVKAIDSAQSDSVVILNPRSTNDVTDNEGRDSDYVVSNREGVLRPNYTLFTAVGSNVAGPVIEDPRVRVSYRYGIPYGTADHSGTAADFDFQDSNWSVSSTVHPDVRDAVALRVAGRILGSDQYGEMSPSGGDDSPSLSDAVKNWKSESKDMLNPHVHVTP